MRSLLTPAAIKGCGKSITGTEPAPTSVAHGVGGWLLHELYDILPPVIFLFVGFSLIILTTNLILADYSLAVGNVMLATGAALVVGKAVLVADAMPFSAATIVPRCSGRYS